MHDEEFISRMFGEADAFLAAESEIVLPYICKRERDGKIVFYSGSFLADKKVWSKISKTDYEAMRIERDLQIIRKNKLLAVRKIRERLFPILGNYKSLCEAESECQKSLAEIKMNCSASDSGVGDNHDEYITLLGETVRSKSEQSIADSLTRAGVPYEYEPSMFDDRIHPDFVIRDSIMGRTVIWEHFGLMNDSDYVYNFISKKAFYKRNGYIEGYNFIATFEYYDSLTGKAVTFSVRDAEKVIKEWFLP